MSNRIEQRWVSIVNSPGYRRLLSSPAGSTILGSGVVQGSKLLRRRLVSSVVATRDRQLLAGVKTCFLFIGHTKSGGSLLGSMLDAHQRIACSDELDILDHLERGFGRDQIMALIIRNSRREALKGRMTARRLEAYALEVPGQWQGRFAALEAVGDARAGRSTRRLAADPGLLQRLRTEVEPSNLKLIHVIRHPMDPIGAMVARSGRAVEAAIDDYSEQCRRLMDIRSRLTQGELMEVHYEDVIRDPDVILTDISRHLEVEPDAAHIEACRVLLDPEPRLDRTRITWAPDHLRRLESGVRNVEFLTRYEVGG
jgi:hypothetical protein